MKKGFLLLCFAAPALVTAGCAYRHYLGLHGPTIKRYAEIHDGVTKDHECLDCHHPDRDHTGPPTSHPGFKGCLKCHNDDLKRRAS